MSFSFGAPAGGSTPAAAPAAPFSFGGAPAAAPAAAAAPTASVGSMSTEPLSVGSVKASELEQMYPEEEQELQEIIQTEKEGEHDEELATIATCSAIDSDSDNDVDENLIDSIIGTTDTSLLNESGVQDVVDKMMMNDDEPRLESSFGTNESYEGYSVNESYGDYSLKSSEHEQVYAEEEKDLQEIVPSDEEQEGEALVIIPTSSTVDSDTDDRVDNSFAKGSSVVHDVVDEVMIKDDDNLDVEQSNNNASEPIQESSVGTNESYGDHSVISSEHEQVYSAEEKDLQALVINTASTFDSDTDDRTDNSFAEGSIDTILLNDSVIQDVVDEVMIKDDDNLDVEQGNSYTTEPIPKSYRDDLCKKCTPSSSNKKCRYIYGLAAFLFVIAVVVGMFVGIGSKNNLSNQQSNSDEEPAKTPTEMSSVSPSTTPSIYPSTTPSIYPSTAPTVTPSKYPSTVPTVTPSTSPTITPTASPFSEVLRTFLTDPTVLDDPTSLQFIAFQFILAQIDMQPILSSDLDETYHENSMLRGLQQQQLTSPFFNKDKLLQRFSVYVMHMSFLQPRPLQPPNIDECDLSYVTCGSGIQNNTGVSGPILEEISLPKYGLQGALPNELGLLTSLVHLDLGENDITGSIPGEFYQLSHLQRLYLHNNKITGHLSENIGNMQSLVDVFLSDNQLTGSIPENIRSPSNNPLKIRPLKYLYLNQNDLSGTIPEDLRLKRALVIDLSFNKIGGTIPYSMLDRHHALRHLYLDHNRLVGSIPENLGTVGNGRLRDAFMNDNMLTGGIPNTFVSLTGLFNMNMQHNQLTEPLAWGLCQMSVFAEGELAELAVDCDICSCKGTLCDQCYE